MIERTAIHKTGQLIDRDDYFITSKHVVSQLSLRHPSATTHNNEQSLYAIVTYALK